MSDCIKIKLLMDKSRIYLYVYFFVFDIEVRILRFSDYFPGSNEKRRKTEIERRKVKKRYENDKKNILI